MSQQEALSITDQSDFERVRSYFKYVATSAEHGLTTANVQKIIHSNDLHFDLVINGDFFHESWLMFAHKFNAPMIAICKFNLNQKGPNHRKKWLKLSFLFC